MIATAASVAVAIIGLEFSHLLEEGAPPMSTATVDLTRVSRKTDPTYAGVNTSSWGRPSNDAGQKAAELKLDVRSFRITARWNGSRIVGVDGLDTEAVVKDLYSRKGVRIQVIILGRQDDWNGYQNGDTTAIVNRLKAIGCTDLSRFDFAGPNEPDMRGIGINDVANRCKQIATELAGAGQGGKVWGPVWSNPGGDFNGFSNNLGKQLGGISYHSYPGGGGLDERSIDTALADAADHGNVISRVRSMLDGKGMTDVGINIDEFNWSWDHNRSGEACFGPANTVLMALGYCTTLAAGGRVMAFTTQNGDMSIFGDGATDPRGYKVPQGSPMPAYWGIAALTGAGLWPHYKDAFYAVSGEDTPAVRTFAVNNEAGGINVIVVNRGRSDSQHTVKLGYKGTYTAWQTVAAKPYDQPVKTRTNVAFDGSVSFGVPALTVTVLVLGPADGAGPVQGGTGGTTTPPPVVVPPVTTAVAIAAAGATVPSGWTAKGATVTGGEQAANAGAVTGLPAGVPQELFAGERWGDQVWTLTGIPAKGALLELLFAEKFEGVTAAGQRTFSVEVNGVVVEAAFDVFARVGGRNKVARLTYQLANVTTVTVRFKSVTANAFINGLRVTAT